jgi:hypothetical protein
MDPSAFPCALGDVVVRASDGAEAWLGAAIVLREDAPTAVLFVCPEAGGDRVVYARPLPDARIAWLMPVPAEPMVAGREPPSAIEIEGARFDRVRRLPLRVTAVGADAPEVGATAILGEYQGRGADFAVIVAGEKATLAFRGARLDPHEYDVWRGDSSGAGQKRRR